MRNDADERVGNAERNPKVKLSHRVSDVHRGSDVEVTVGHVVRQDRDHRRSSARCLRWLEIPASARASHGPGPSPSSQLPVTASRSKSPSL